VKICLNDIEPKNNKSEFKMSEIIFHMLFGLVLMGIPYIGSDDNQKRLLRDKIKKSGRLSLSSSERKLAVKYGLIR
tara:strand:- start:1124 stop:1351 length:228 start_codon:yes stop_codon:yes gene_type:complete